jgi:uncharacterized protein (DUF169 family)
MKEKDFKKFIQILGVDYSLVGIFFAEKVPRSYKKHNDTVCTALARAFLKKQASYFNGTSHRQSCRGADYYFKFENIEEKEVIKNYVKDECVFFNKSVGEKFIQNTPKFPKKLIGKVLVIKPFAINDMPEVVVLLLSPSQVGRVIGLLNYTAVDGLDVLPSQSTCISLFAPLVTGKPHVNFIDYYDRYYQGVINNKKIWPESHMIISITYKQLCEMVANFKKSAHGSFVPKIAPQKVDNF